VCAYSLTTKSSAGNMARTPPYFLHYPPKNSIRPRIPIFCTLLSSFKGVALEPSAPAFSPISGYLRDLCILFAQLPVFCDWCPSALGSPVWSSILAGWVVFDSTLTTSSLIGLPPFHACCLGYLIWPQVIGS